LKISKIFLWKSLFSSDPPFTGKIKKIAISNHKDENGYNYKNISKSKKMPWKI